jgi:hypothetical protein
MASWTVMNATTPFNCGNSNWNVRALWLVDSRVLVRPTHIVAVVHVATSPIPVTAPCSWVRYTSILPIGTLTFPALHTLLCAPWHIRRHLYSGCCSVFLSDIVLRLLATGFDSIRSVQTTCLYIYFSRLFAVWLVILTKRMTTVISRQKSAPSVNRWLSFRCFVLKRFGVSVL